MIESLTPWTGYTSTIDQEHVYYVSALALRSQDSNGIAEGHTFCAEEPRSHQYL